ncbi:naiP_11 [Blepharisma stoltei]|uniref:Major facilitator superfamily (MFS) profile domain-containing protein n=1 Tax=Blepharisma stoltei TaxID=1481888 RepID=A0AAU9K4K8_9CILI|nr:unnamed protein product [Blepharisma stoltei]
MDEAMVLVGVYLDKLGWGNCQSLVFIQCGLALSAAQAWMLSQSFVLIGAGHLWDLSSTIKGLIGSCLQIGMLIGSLVFGTLGDKHGRIYSFKKCVWVNVAACFCLIFSFHYSMMMLFYLLLGIGVGGDLTLAGTTFSEFCPPEKRWLLAGLSCFYPIGGMIASGINLFVYGVIGDEDHDWRYIVGAFFIIELCLALWRLKLYETPAYYIMIGQESDAEETLKRIAKENGQFKSFTSYHQAMLSIVRREELASKKEKLEGFDRIKSLFSKKNRKTTICITLVNFLTFSGYISLLIFMPTFLNDFSQLQIYLIILMQTVIALPGNIFGSFLVRSKFGRRNTLAMGLGISGTLCILFFIDVGDAVTIGCIAIINALILISVGALTTITAESYDTEIRSCASGWHTAFGRLGGIVSPMIIGRLLDTSNGDTISVTIFAICFFLAGMFACLLKETRKVQKKGVLRMTLQKSMAIQSNPSKSQDT